MNRQVTIAISSLKTKLRGILPQLLEQEVQALIEQISDGFEEALEQKKAEIQKTQEEREQRIHDIEAEITALDTAREHLQAAATQTLYKVR